MNRSNFLASEWERIYQIVKVEEPCTAHEVHRFCRFDLKPGQVDDLLLEMCHAKKLQRVEIAEREYFALVFNDDAELATRHAEKLAR
jgi:hypothetical protein